MCKPPRCGRRNTGFVYRSTLQRKPVFDHYSLNIVALQVRMYSRALAIIGGFLVLASGAGEVYRQKPRSRSLQSTGQVFLGVYLICMVKPPSSFIYIVAI